MVCAATTPLSIPRPSSQRFSDQIRPVKPFHPPAIRFADIYEKRVDLIEWYIFRKNHIKQDDWPLNCCAIACGLSQKIWRVLVDMNWMDSRRRLDKGVTVELQDEPFAFCGRTGIACMDLLNRVFNTHLIGFLLRATKQERKSALKRLKYCVPPKAVFPANTSKAVIPASERKCLHCRRWRRSSTLEWYSRVTEVGTKRLIHGLVKATQFCVSFIAPWLRNGRF